MSATQGGAAAVHPRTTVGLQTTKKRSNKGRIKSSTVAIYASVFVLLVSVIAIGYRTPQQTSDSASAAPVVSVAQQPEQKAATVNDVVASNVAASVAHVADLAVAPNVAELAVSTRIQSSYGTAMSDNTSVVKPAIVQATSASRQITKYKVLEGDTVDSIAAKFGVSADTIKWANNLTSNSVAVDSELEVLPRNGVVYVVKDGDTIEKIAEKYKADVSLVRTYNDLEINGVTTGLKLIIPGGTLPDNERPGYVAPRTVYNSTPSTSTPVGYGTGFGGTSWHIKTGTPMYGGNKYAYGNCTAYAYDRRVEMGRPVGGMWGNASSWAANAIRAGYVVNRTPAVGAVIQNGGGYGHVGIVERVLPNGDIEISEMNAYVSGGGFNKVSGRIVSAAVVGQYVYIH